MPFDAGSAPIQRPPESPDDRWRDLFDVLARYLILLPLLGVYLWYLASDAWRVITLALEHFTGGR